MVACLPPLCPSRCPLAAQPSEQRVLFLPPAPGRPLFGIPVGRAKGLDSWLWVSECSLVPQWSPGQRVVHSNASKKKK